MRAIIVQYMPMIVIISINFFNAKCEVFQWRRQTIKA